MECFAKINNKKESIGSKFCSHDFISDRSSFLVFFKLLLKFAMAEMEMWRSVTDMINCCPNASNFLSLLLLFNTFAFRWKTGWLGVNPAYPGSQVQIVWNSAHVLASEGFVSVLRVSVKRKMRQEQNTREKAGERRKGNFPSSLIILSSHASQDHLLSRLPTFQPTVQACFGMPALQAPHVLSQRYIWPKLETFSFVIYLRWKFDIYQPCLD